MERNEIILSKGVYQMIKTHLSQDRKLSDFNKKKLIRELKSARIIPTKEFPKNVVAINTKVRITDIETDQVYTFELVAPNEAKISNYKISVLSPFGLALLGYNSGEEVNWEMPDGLKRYRIESVEVPA